MIDKHIHDLIHFLEIHEQDIANQIDNFEILTDLFFELFNRYAGEPVDTGILR